MSHVEVLKSDYVMDQLNDNGCSAHELKEPRLPTAIPSQYVDLCLRQFVSVNDNPNYQEYPSTIQHTTLLGKPVSSNELRHRVDSLESGVYSPMIIHGKLFFVALEGDVRTAHSPSSSDSEQDTLKTAASLSNADDDNITFTLGELKSILPLYAIRSLMKHCNANNIRHKTMSREQSDLMKLQDALRTVAEFSNRHVPNHPALKPIDLMNTNDPSLVKLREMLNINQAQCPLNTPTAACLSGMAQSMDLSTSVTGDMTSTSSVTSTKSYTSSNYSGRNTEAKPVNFGSTPVSRMSSNSSAMATGNDFSEKTAVSRPMLSRVMPSDHAATSNADFSDILKTAVNSNTSRRRERHYDTGMISGGTPANTNRGDIDQMQKLITQEELDEIKTANMMSPRSGKAHDKVNE